MIAAMMVATVAAKAQFSEGTFTLQPKVGFNMSSVTADDTKYKAGLSAGIEGQYQINNWFALAAGVMYEQQGTKLKNVDDFKWKMDYVNIPVMAKFYVTKGLSLNIGLQPGFMVNSKFENSNHDGVDTKDVCNTFDLSMPMSIAYELPMGLVFEARYTTGLTNVGKEEIFGQLNSDFDKIYKNKNDVFLLTVGYKFAL